MNSLRSIGALGVMGVMVLAGVWLGGASASAEGYGPAGCGLGSIIIGSEPGFSQVFAATTNGTSQSQTFGITSGTSNCDWKPGKQARAFIEGNREAFVKDMARGRGETITALSTIAGCESAKRLGTRLQERFRSLVPDASSSDAQVSERVIDLLRSDTSLACVDLS